VAELVAADVFEPGSLVRQGMWRNLSHWWARAALVGGTASVLLKSAGPIGALVLAMLAPSLLATTVGTHLDQFREDRPLVLREQLGRWSRHGAELWPVFLLYLMAGAVVIALASPLGIAGGYLALAGLAFLGLAWSGSMGHRLLAGGDVLYSFRVGLRDAGRWVLQVPVGVLRLVTWRGPTPSGVCLVSNFLLTAFASYLAMAVGFSFIFYPLVFGAFVHGPLPATIALATGLTLGWHTFEAGVGRWVYHYLAFLAEERGLLTEAPEAPPS
jgi:hypothetical protein